MPLTIHHSHYRRHTMNTPDTLTLVAEKLRDILKNDNDGPRLIAEMLEEFPKITDAVKSESYDEMTALEEQIDRLREERDDAQAEADAYERKVSKLEDEIEELKEELHRRDGDSD